MSTNQNNKNKENKLKNDSKINETNTANVNAQIYDDEIELRELIMILWNHKVLIIAITLMLALLAGVFSKFFTTPVYQTRFSIVARIPENYNTIYGSYDLPIKTNAEYINLIKSNEVIKHTIKDLGHDPKEVSVQSISNRISFEDASGGDQSIFVVKVNGPTPQEAVDLANTLYDNYVEYIDVMLKDRAINYYYNDFSINLVQNETQIASNKDLLERHEDLLKTVPNTIDQSAAMEEIPNTNDYIVLENIINPNYTNLEYRVLEIKQDINVLESENKQYSAYIEELTEEKSKLDEYYQADEDVEFDSNITDNMDIFKLSEPITPGGKSSPNVTRNIVIAGLLGGMIGVFTAFFMAYWKREI